MKQNRKINTIQQRLKSKLSKDETISIRFTTDEMKKLLALAEASTRAIGKEVSVNKIIHTIIEEYLDLPDIKREIESLLK